MRPFNVKLLGCIGLLVGIGLVGTMGCGDSGDPVDEIGYRYQISDAVPEDRGDPTSDIDVWQDCDNIFEDPDDDGEDPLTKAQVALTFQSNTDQLDIWVYRIRIDYDLIEYTGNPAATPSIPSNIFDIDIFIPGDNGSSGETVDLLGTADKASYRALLGLNDNGLQTRAVFQVTLTAFLTYKPNDPETHIEIKKHFTINVQNWKDDSCPVTTP